MTAIDEIHAEVAEEHCTYRYVSRACLRAQLELVARAMSSEKFEAVRLKHLGIFKVSKARAEHLSKIIDLSKDQLELIKNLK